LLCQEGGSLSGLTDEGENNCYTRPNSLRNAFQIIMFIEEELGLIDWKSFQGGGDIVFNNVGRPDTNLHWGRAL